jgi:hypothetical protein
MAGGWVYIMPNRPDGTLYGRRHASAVIPPAVLSLSESLDLTAKAR